MNMTEEYNCMFAKCMNGEITKEEWQNYCLKYLEFLMEEQKEVLQHLKFMN